MDYTYSKELYNNIVEMLSTVNRQDGLNILGKILDREYDLRMAGCIVKEDCEIDLSKSMLEDCFYSEGNDEAGFISLKRVLKAAEQVINCDDYSSANISFEHFVRPETPEESEDAEHSDSVEWWTKDENIDIDKLYIQFQS